LCHLTCEPDVAALAGSSSRTLSTGADEAGMQNN